MLFAGKEMIELYTPVNPVPVLHQCQPLDSLLYQFGLLHFLHIKTKIDIPLLFARNVSVSNGIINLKYGEINLGSIYGIYDKTSDKITMHIPISTALQYLPHNI